MELKSSYPYYQPQPSSTLPSTRRNSFHGVGADTTTVGGGGGRNSFGHTFSDSLCSLNLKEASEFARPCFPMAATMARSSSSSNGHVHGHGRHHDASSTSSSSSSAASAQRQRRADHQQQVVPATPGRPLQFFTSPAHHNQLVAPRRSVPSKWEDAEKWLRKSTGSDRHCGGNGKAAFSRQRSGGMGHRGGGGEHEKRAPVTVRRSVDALADAHALSLYTPPAEVLLKDKFTDNEAPSKESFVFHSSYHELPAAKGSATAAVDHRKKDVGTEMTPLGSSTTSRCHTPVKSTSPARHNTPADRSGPLVPYAGGGGMDISELADCHLAKLGLGARFDAMLVNWCSKEEDEEVSKSLRHFEASTAGASAGTGLPYDKRGGGGGGDCRWEDDDRAKSCIRYQREEAKIQAWINLESAKAEAQSRKLEVKIQKMRSSLEEKLMRRMSTVHRRAEEWRAGAQAQHLQQLRRAADTVRWRIKAASHSHHRLHLPGSDVAAVCGCGCFPCNGDVASTAGNLLNYPLG